MANITTRVQFQKGLITIPNIISDEAAKTLLDNAIAEYEPRLLRELMGYSFYKDFKAYIDAVTPPPSNQIFDDLLNGVEYTDANGQLQKYEGLKVAQCSHYIFFKLLTETTTKHTDVGEYLAQTENGNIVSSANRMAEVWNRMVIDNIAFYEFIDTKPTDYQSIISYGGSVNLISKINEYGI